MFTKYSDIGVFDAAESFKVNIDDYYPDGSSDFSWILDDENVHIVPEE